VGVGMVGLGVGVGEAVGVGVGVGVGDDVCARATCMVIVRTKNSRTAAVTGCPSPHIPLFSGFIDLDPRRMNRLPKKRKTPATAKAKPPARARIPNTAHGGRKIFSRASERHGREQSASAFGLKSLQRSLRRARQGLQIGDTKQKTRY
jgi:hypothetical protein